MTDSARDSSAHSRRPMHNQQRTYTQAEVQAMLSAVQQEPPVNHRRRPRHDHQANRFPRHR
jgi:hypothetical protein